MTGNPGITVMQMESALNNMQNTMINEDGSFNLDDTFFELFIMPLKVKTQLS